MKSVAVGLLLAVVALPAAPVAAEPSHEVHTVTVPGSQGIATSSILYINRCRGGCTIHKVGAPLSDARTNSSWIPMGDATDYQLAEFAWPDAEWDQVMTCLKEVYSPYAVQITDVQPTAGEAYNEAILAGKPSELGLPNSYGGIAPVSGDCSPLNYTVSFSFANIYGANDRVYTLCGVVAQESGHAFGLLHSYEFQDHTSACKDPMSYRNDCGGEKFFRNDQATCGEYTPRACECGGTQNSHLKLLSALGAGTPITKPPVVTVTAPAMGTTIPSGATVIATASAQRGIAKLELWLNGYLWATTKGVAWGPTGQPEAGYPIAIPADVPDGIIDIVVKAKDDIEVTTVAPTVTVTKGAPCTSADACAKGQKCDAGRCLWDPPSGAIGDACTFAQFCLSGVCQGTSSETICTQGCIVGVTDSCPADFDCLESSPGKGICWPKGAASSGCCSASNTAAAQSAFVAFALLLVIGPRRRRRR